VRLDDLGPSTCPLLADLGAYNTVINEAPDVDNLSEMEAVERDCFIYRSYIAMGSYEVRGGRDGLGLNTLLEAAG
jgi:hypothetical protein